MPKLKIHLLCLLLVGVHLSQSSEGSDDDDDGLPPSITEQPVDTVVARHQPATLNCRASGRPSPIIRWYKNNVPLRLEGSHHIQLPGGELFFLRVSHGRQHSDAGTYMCEATNLHGTARSRNATLQVAVLREEFRIEPISTMVAQGDSTLLECSPPKGTPEPKVSWKKNGIVLDLEQTPRVHLVENGNLVIENTLQSDNGTYQCLARNAAGSRESAVAHLKVNVKPYLIAKPQDVLILSGSSATFQCLVGGDPLPDILWRRSARGGNMPLGRVHILEDRSLRLDAVTLEDQGEYICEADNSVGALTVSGMLTVHARPSFQIRPTTESVEDGSQVIFHCLAVGNPKPTIFWTIDSNTSLIFPGKSWGRYSSTLNTDSKSTMLLENITFKDSGSTVSCSAVNEVGAVTTRAKVLVYSKDPPPPIIEHGPANQTLPTKSIAIFHCSATGDPIPVISWYHNGKPVMPNHKTNISQAGTLTIKDLEMSDNGKYICVASSKNGKSVWSGNLKVDSPRNPSINFFRGAELSLLPGAPTKPQIKNITETSITIVWTQNNKIGSSSLLGYQIEMFGKDLKIGNSKVNKNDLSWTIVATKFQGTTFTQNGLIPDNTYVFIIRAENSHGFSPPSKTSDPVTIKNDFDYTWGSPAVSFLIEARAHLLSDSIVTLVDAVAVESTTIKLIWKTLNAEYLEGFYVYYKPNENNKNDADYNMLTVLYSATTASVAITGLHKFTKYELFLLPFYKNIIGRPSNSRIATTLEDVPDDVPVNIEALVLNSTAVYLKWKPPPPFKQNGIITSYQVVVRLDEQTNHSSIFTNVTVDANSNTLLLGNLKPAVSYTVQLAAATKEGIGPFSLPATLRLDSSSFASENEISNSINKDFIPSVANDLLAEKWFLSLIASVITVMALLFAAIILIVKRHIIMKNSALPDFYDKKTDGIVVRFKEAVGMNNTNKSVTRVDSLLWMDKQPNIWRQTERDLRSQDFSHGTVPLPSYDKINNQSTPDYAEVDACLITFQNKSPAMNDAAPAYASATIVSNKKHRKGSMGVLPRNAENFNDNAFKNDDINDVYSRNDTTYHRNVYSDTYLGNNYISKFDQSPDLCDTTYNIEDRNIHHPKLTQTTNGRLAPLSKGSCGTIRRSHRMAVVRTYNPNKKKTDFVNNRFHTDKSRPYREMNPPDKDSSDSVSRNSSSTDDGDRSTYENIQPMRPIEHHYSRPSVIEQFANKETSFSSNKTDFILSTVSEPSH